MLRQVLALLIGLIVSGQALAMDDYWSERRRGANFFNETETEQRFADAAATGIEFVRLAPDKWASAREHFLIGSCDHYTGLVEADLIRLVEVLDMAERNQIRVVLVMLSLPGACWRQHNDDRSDPRMWQSLDFHQQAAAFWHDLAAAIRDHPALAAVSPLNEPHPHIALGGDLDPGDPAYADWVEQAHGSAADLNAFNRTLVDAIRDAAPNLPVMLDAGSHADYQAIAFLEPINDDKLLYSGHVYDPWRYTALRANRGQFRYPDRMPVGWSDAVESWPEGELSRRFDRISDWATDHDIPASRIIISEFGVSRLVPGATAYMTDLVGQLEARGWHWAFYAFREDSWDEMDYELPLDLPCLNPSAEGLAIPPACRVASRWTESNYRVKPWAETDLFAPIAAALGRH